jgi:hypothetical protein
VKNPILGDREIWVASSNALLEALRPSPSAAPPPKAGLDPCGPEHDRVEENRRPRPRGGGILLRNPWAKPFGKRQAGHEHRSDQEVMSTGRLCIAPPGPGRQELRVTAGLRTLSPPVAHSERAGHSNVPVTRDTVGVPIRAKTAAFPASFG